MNSKLLLNHFDRISDEPDAVRSLRRFILDLAVRGKLLEQDPKDEPASELLKRILAEFRTASPGTVASPENVHPFPIPASWTWVKLGEAAHLEMGQSPPSEHYNQSQEGIPFYQGKTDFGKKHPTPRYWCTHPGKLALKGDILISVRAPVGPTNVANEKCCIGRGLAALRPRQGVDRDFILLCLKSFEVTLASLGFGTTFVAINKKHLVSFPIPFAPAPEQHRIVAKVDELMALCERLDVVRAERENRLDHLTAAAHYHLNNNPNAEDFRKRANFFLGNFPRLTTRVRQVHHVRQTILSLAVRGQLVSQDANDEPASILLQRLGEEIGMYARERRIAPPRPEPINEREIPYPAPAGWIWTRLTSIFKVITDGDHQPPPKEREGVAFLTIGNVTTGSLDFSNCRFVSPSYLESVAEYRKPSFGDILYTVVGATYGRPVLVDTKRPFCVQRHIAILKPPRDADIEFLRILLTSTLVYSQATKSATGAAQPTVALKPLRNFLVPLPPLAEQHRIVAKVDELMKVCDRLEVQLNTAQNGKRRLLGSVLHHALNNSPGETSKNFAVKT